MTTKITIDNIEYSIHKQESGNLLLRLKMIQINNLDKLSQYDFCNSKIIFCNINDKLCDKNKYKAILKNIYDIINSGTKIIKNTTLNIETIKKEYSGFYYLDKLGISVQGVDANKCLYEIINQCKKNNITIDIKIKLSDNKLINVVI
jgi:predicted RNA methylase